LTLAYGWWRLHEIPPGSSGPSARVALIQGSLDTIFPSSVEEYERRKAAIYEHYRGLTNRAVTQTPDLDLVIWPESMFPDAEVLIDDTAAQGGKISVEELNKRRQELQVRYQSLLAAEAALANANTNANHPGTLLLVGTTTLSYGQQAIPKMFNTALLADRAGKILGRYYKTHPVMFGEYIPFGDAIPLLYQITPMTAGLSVGDGPTVFEVAGLKMSPSVCFESSVPHLIRKQIAELKRRGTPPDVLVNVTNDGWFWGSGMLDIHFRCGVFRAVENRKPLIVAANTGFSTWIDGSGVIRARGPRRQPRILVADVRPDGRQSPYQILGDWPASLCAASCIGLALLALRKRPVAAD
jgi:apolipoprotein N-acyltransferase